MEYRKMNNPSQCVERIQEKLEDYKLSCKEICDDKVRRQFEMVINDLEEILYD